MFMNPQDNTSRRSFFKKITITGAVSAIAPQVWAGKGSGRKISLESGNTILFQGDSITDGSRKKDVAEANNTAALGTGYAFLAGADLLEQHAAKQLRIFNRGISGNKVYQLAERWDADCLALKPDVLSILIGVNDFWHMINGKYDGTLAKYVADYETLLSRTKTALPNVKLVIGEPFAVLGVKAVTDNWFPLFNDYRSAAKNIAAKFDAVFVPYQSVFDKAQKTAPGSYWTGDGVHPSLAGAKLMAKAWLEAVK